MATLFGLSVLLLCGVTSIHCQDNDIIKNILSELNNESSNSSSSSASISLPPRSLRLPNTTYPLHYELHIVTHIHREILDYTGNVTIDVLVKESTDEVVLHAQKLRDFVITVRESATGEPVEDIGYTYDAKTSFLIIHTNPRYQAFEAGQEFRIEILYGGRMNTKTRGIYWMTYSDVNSKPVYLAATQFEPTSARLAFPCYDEPAFKSNFTIRITHGSNYTAISNMDVLGEPIVGPDNMTTTTFRDTPPISTYLLAFVVSNFEHIAMEHRNVLHRVFTPPNATFKGHHALSNSQRTVAALEDYIGIPYSLSKLDHIALEINYGSAMENWGLITYKKDSLLSNENLDDEDSEVKLRDLITQIHEISHQWFGNLVSPEWWTYAWLNEGFATYFGYLIADMIYPELKVMEFFMIDVVERAFSSITVRPMTKYVEKESQIMSVFDYIIYHRAACVIKMFHHSFNDRTFMHGINKFLSKYQYAVANEDQLFRAIQEAVYENESFAEQEWRASIPQIMHSWTHSEGIPIVVVQRNYEDNTISIRQRSKDINSQERWWIPLNFATASQPDFNSTRVEYFMPEVAEITLTAAQLGMPLQQDDWLIVNKQQTGFYHVLYDDVNLMAIAHQLRRNHTAIHELNRAAIFQDLCPLIEHNEIQKPTVIFELLAYLEHEEDLIPWNSVADVVSYFDKILFATHSHQPYMEFVRRLVAPIFGKLHDKPHTHLTNTEILARQKLLEMACDADLPECLELTRRLAHDYFFRQKRFVTDVNMNYYAIHDSILCLGVKYLNDQEFANILTLLSQTESSALLYDDIIYALRCTQSHSHIRDYLTQLLGENSTHLILDERDSMLYLSYVYRSNRAARPVVWRFFEQNYKLLCQSPNFIEHFNRIAEYTPQRHQPQFLALRQLISDELHANGKYSEGILIDADSPRISKMVKLSEMYVVKFGPEIDEWLRRDKQPITLQALAMGARSDARSIGHPWRLVGRLFRKILQIKL